MTSDFNFVRMNALAHEFKTKLIEMHALYLDSVSGYELLHEKLETIQEYERRWLVDPKFREHAFQDELLAKYSDLGVSDHRIYSLSPVMKQGEIRKRVEQGGRNCLLLGNLVLVSISDYWNDYLRPEIGKATGIIPENATNTEESKKALKKLSYNIWGDIRLYRNSIVHHGGIATKEMKRCKLLKWFSPGNQIALDYEKMRAIFYELAVFRNILFSMSIHRKGVRISDHTLSPKG